LRIGIFGFQRLRLKLDLSDKPIAAAAECFDISWFGARIAQCLAKLVYGFVQAVFELNVNPIGPQTPPQILAAYQRSGMLNQDSQYPSGFFCQPQADAILEEFQRRKIESERAKNGNSGGMSPESHLAASSQEFGTNRF
jgi:hypothetical protein